MLESGPSQGAAPLESPTLEPGQGAPGSPPGEPAFPVPGWERYQPVRFLGQGGMGQVFLAYEPLLRRNVALKFVREADTQLARRFLTEARAQARVRHARVCEVYEVGEVLGRGYISMRYVDGPSLAQLAPRLTLEQKVLVLRLAAEGVHAAHRAGFIHRDLKPSNILVERTEDGALEPYVMDFGLARDWRDESSTTQAALGTPHYMAPEQARGEVARLDRRVDVYGLGATLYTLLTGQPPFTGSNSLEVIARLQAEEPRPPRALEPDLPADLEAIVLKCLEKERTARYDSARALAEDLERFLSGEPVRARRAGPGYWLRKKARRHRGALALGTAALLVVALALGQSVQARREVAERERLSRRFTERVERLEALARYSALSRLHDTREDRRALRADMEALGAEVRQAGPEAAGPGDYALGRALLALGDVPAARERLESAWAHGYRAPRVAYALALVLGRLYQEQLREVERLREAPLREARREQLQRALREPALGYLRQAEGPDVPAPAAYVSSLLAFHEGRYDDALGHLEAMGQALPWFYEAPLLRGDILQARASRHAHAGERAQALADFEASRQAYAAAASTAQSAPGVHTAQARLELASLLLPLYGPGEVWPHYQRGLAALQSALAAAPEDAEPRVLEASLHLRLAELRTHQGDEAEALLDKALAACRAAEALAPTRPGLALLRALIFRQWAHTRLQAGRDARVPLRQALEALEAVPEAQRDALYHTHRGLAFKAWADFEQQHGGDALSWRSRSIDAYRAALALDERQPEAWMNLGIAHLKRSMHPQAEDQEGDVERARQALERAHTLDPQHVVPLFHGADLQLRLAQRQRDREGDWVPHARRALELYRQGVAINPRLPQLHNGLGAALLWWAQQAGEDAQDARPLLAQAQAAFEQARAVAPQQSFAHNNLGELYFARALALRQRGEDPRPSLRAAVEASQQALARSSGHADPWVNLARVYQLEAEWALEHGGNPQPQLARAAEAFQRAQAINPHHALAWRTRGEALGVRARQAARRGTARDEDFAQAARALEQALRLEPHRLEHLLAAASLQGEWGAWRRRSALEPRAPLERALALVDEVLATRPRWARARRLRERLLQALEASP